MASGFLALSWAVGSGGAREVCGRCARVPPLTLRVHSLTVPIIVGKVLRVVLLVRGAREAVVAKVVVEVGGIGCISDPLAAQKASQASLTWPLGILCPCKPSLRRGGVRGGSLWIDHSGCWRTLGSGISWAAG